MVALDPHNGHKLVKEVSEEILPILLVQAGIGEDVLVVVNDLFGGSLKRIIKKYISIDDHLKNKLYKFAFPNQGLVKQILYTKSFVTDL